MSGLAIVKLLPLPLFTKLDPTTKASIDVSIKANNTCTRHQLTITCSPDPAAAGTVKVRGISSQSALAPAHFDSRLDAIDMTHGSQVFIFYGAFDGLRFDFASFTGGTLSAALLSHEDELTISGNTP